MLTGELPFKGEHEQAVVYSIRKDLPRPIREVDTEIPPSIEQVVDKALAKDVDRRYQQVDELLDDLKSISAGIVPEEIKARLRKIRLRKRKRAILYAGAAGLVIAISLLALSLFTGRAEAIDSIAVLPLKNLTGDTEKEFFVDIATEELIGLLGQISGLRRVISRTSAMRFKETDKTLSEIARELNVDVVVEGSVQQAGDRVRIQIRLIDALPEEQNLWGKTYERDMSDVLVMYGEMARAIADISNVQLTEEETARLSIVRQVDPEAYDAYLKGSHHWKKLTPEEIDTAQKYFELALEKDPSFARAYGSISFIWMARATSEAAAAMPHEAAPKAKEAAARSLELDSTQAEPHFALASIATWYDWNWETAEREFRLAIKYNPNFAESYVFYGLFLTAMNRCEEAIENMERALELDPHNFMYHTYLGTAMLRGRQYDRAISQFQKGLELEPNFLDALGGLWSCYHKKEMYEDALIIAKRHFMARGEQDVAEALERGMRERGYQAAMRSAADVLAGYANDIYALRIATLYTYAEEKDLALEWIEKGYQVRLQNMIYLNVHPKWDYLRDDPRFVDLLRKMSFPEDEKE
jgi:TolB-like protein/Tfp pilus assembly protein PilF